MSINFGTDNIGEIRFGNNRITKVYFGDTMVYDKPYVKIKFHFDRTNVNPRGKLGTRAKACGAEWISSDDPQIWYVITPLYDKGTAPHDTLTGVGKLFCNDGSDENGTLLQSSVGTCQVLEITGDVDRIETLDRIFNKCSAITSVSTTGFYDKFTGSTALVNVNSLVNNNTNITDGTSLYGYGILKDLTNISTHAATFSNADSAANLALIPVGWGGTQVPPSTQTTSTAVAYTSNNKTGWIITGNEPDWTDIIGVYLLTTTSVSSFTGVSMNRSRIPNTLNGLGTTQGTYALYFYPAFVQCSKIPGQSGNTVSWIATTDTPNGSLTASQGNTDMAGILDYSTYGPITRTYGTYDSSSSVYFVFLVTNYPITDYDPITTTLSSIPMGFLYNANFNADAGLRWFT